MLIYGSRQSMLCDNAGPGLRQVEPRAGPPWVPWAAPGAGRASPDRARGCGSQRPANKVRRRGWETRAIIFRPTLRHSGPGGQARWARVRALKADRRRLTAGDLGRILRIGNQELVRFKHMVWRLAHYESQHVVQRGGPMVGSTFGFNRACWY